METIRYQNAMIQLQTHRNRLQLKPVRIKLNIMDTRLFKFRRQPDTYAVYLDINIDGANLSAAVKANNPNAPADTTLIRNDFPLKEQLNYVERLLGRQPPDLLSGRTGIFYCPIDGDPLCGMVACYIEFNRDTVRWYDFVWDGDGGEPDDSDDYDYDAVDGLSEYIFDRQEYEATLGDALRNLDTPK